MPSSVSSSHVDSEMKNILQMLHMTKDKSQTASHDTKGSLTFLASLPYSLEHVLNGLRSLSSLISVVVLIQSTALGVHLLPSP